MLFATQEKMNRGDDGHTTANGNREASDSAELVAAPNSSAASNRRSHKKGEQKDVTRSRRDKTKRRKSSKTCVTHRSICGVLWLCDLIDCLWERLCRVLPMPRKLGVLPTYVGKRRHGLFCYLISDSFH